MLDTIQFQVDPETAASDALLRQAVALESGVPSDQIRHIQVLKRSIDARQRQVKINLKLRYFTDDSFIEESITLPAYEQVANREEVIIVGAGPAGLFAALRCIELGKKPIVLERGKRIRDRAHIQRCHRGCGVRRQTLGTCVAGWAAVRGDITAGAPGIQHDVKRQVARQRQQIQPPKLQKILSPHRKRKPQPSLLKAAYR